MDWVFSFVFLPQGIAETRADGKTRKELLKVASKMFAKQGFYSTSVDQIAEEAGYSKGAIYSNFGSKDDLFLSVFREN